MSRKAILFLGIVGYVLLMGMALVFYQERTMFSDVSYILFRLLYEGDLAIQVNRFVSLFTQAFGLLASKAGLPLKQVCQIHSVGFIVYYFTIFLVIFKWVKNEKMALGLLLFNTLMVTHSFYWTPSELIQGMAFVFLYFAILYKSILPHKIPIYYYLLGVFALITASFAHPLLNIALVFGLCFMTLTYPTKWRFFAWNFAFIIALFLIKAFVIPNPYDTEAMAGLGNFVNHFPHYLTPSFVRFFKYIIQDYYFLTLLLMGLSVFYLIQKKYLKLLLLASFFVGYAFLVNVSLPDVKNQFYIESQYLVLAFFVILPFVMDLLPRLKNKALAPILLSLIIGVSLFRIYSAHEPYTQRIEWNRNFLVQTADLEEPKLIVPKNKVPQDTLLMTWGSSYEFWLLSTVEQGKTRSIIIEEEENQFNFMFDRRKFWITLWDRPHYNALNPQYFIFEDTITTYQKY